MEDFIVMRAVYTSLWVYAFLDPTVPQALQIPMLCSVLLDTTVPEVHHYPCRARKGPLDVSKVTLPETIWDVDIIKILRIGSYVYLHFIMTTYTSANAI